MATTNLTLYKDNTTSEAFTLGSTQGRLTTYDGASSTPTFPVALDITQDRKQVGNMSNDRFIYTLRRSSAAQAKANIATSSGELKISVAKDPLSGSTLEAEAVAAVAELISYVTGAAPTSTCMANIAKLVVGQLL
jgi:hypothetical protein